MVFVLASLFLFIAQKVNRSLYTPFVQFMGYRSIIVFYQNFYHFYPKFIEIFSKNVCNKYAKPNRIK